MAALVWGLVAVLALLILYPLLTTVVLAIEDAFLTPGSFALDPAIPRVLGNTAIDVLGSAALALVVGALLAWLNERTDASLGTLGELLPLAPLLTPPLAGVIGLVVLFDPAAGLLNGVLRALLGATGIRLDGGPLDLYTLVGLILVTALYLVPYVFLVVSAALSKLDPYLEEASRINRAGPFKTLVRVTLPAVAPALLAAGLLAVISAIGLFSVPVLIGARARFDVLSVYVFRLLTTYPPRTDVALVLAGLMLVVVQGLLLLQRRLAPPGQSAAVGGRGFRSGRVALGRWRGPARGLMLAYLLVTAVLPLAGLVLVSLQGFWTPNVEWDKLTLANYQSVLFQRGNTSQALFDSVGLGIVTATVGMLAAGLLMLYVQQARGAGRRLVDAVTTLPATIPHTVIGVSVLIAFSRPPVSLYGSLAILFVAYLVQALPYAARSASAAAADIGLELAEASRVFGASERRTFLRVLLPIALPGLAAGWAMLFILTAGEVTASALLSSTSNPVIGRVMLDVSSFGSYPQVTALAVVITLINALFVVAVLRLTRRGLDAALR
jgi:iron(III) transport system permease protein